MARLGIIANVEFQKRLLLLTNSKLSLGAAYKLKKLIEQVDAETKRYHDMRDEKVVLPFAELDDDGAPVLTEDGRGVKIQKDLIPEMQKAMAELNDIQVELIRIPLSALENVQDITMQDIQILSEIIDEDA